MNRFLALLAFSLPAFANDLDILKDTVPIAKAICSVDKDFKMFKGAPYQYECFIVAKEDDLTRAWVVINDGYGNAIRIIEINEAKEQKIIWRKGDVSS